MLDPYKKIHVPAKERQFILPDVRVKVFNEIFAKYRDLYGLKFIYGYLNYDPNIKVDYIIIYTVVNEYGNKLVLYDAVPPFSDRSTPGYLYCVKNKLLDDFYDEGINAMTTFPYNKFKIFVEKRLELSFDKNDPKFWKRTENAPELIKELLELSLEYTKNPPKQQSTE